MLCDGVLRLRPLDTIQGIAGVMLGLERGQPRARVFLGIDVLFRARDGGLCGIQIRRCHLGGTGHACGGDRLTRIAHFLHGRARASG